MGTDKPQQTGSAISPSQPGEDPQPPSSHQSMGTGHQSALQQTPFANNAAQHNKADVCLHEGADTVFCQSPDRVLSPENYIAAPDGVQGVVRSSTVPLAALVQPKDSVASEAAQVCDPSGAASADSSTKAAVSPGSCDELAQNHVQPAAAVAVAAAACQDGVPAMSNSASVAGDAASQQVKLSLEWLRTATPEVATAFLMSVEGM